MNRVLSAMVLIAMALWPYSPRVMAFPAASNELGENISDVEVIEDDFKVDQFANDGRDEHEAGVTVETVTQADEPANSYIDD